MSTIYVKPAPSLSPAAARVLKSDTGVGLLDAAGNVPEGGMPWPNGGLTLSLLTDGAILRADDPAFDVKDAPDPKDTPDPKGAGDPGTPKMPAPSLIAAPKQPAPAVLNDTSTAH